MDIRRLQKDFITERTPLVLTVVIFLTVRLVLSEDWLSWQLWAATGIQITSAALLLSLTQVFLVIRQRTLLPAHLYLLFVGTTPRYFDDWLGSLMSLIILLCFYALFATYQRSKSQMNALNISILLTLGSFLWTPILYFLPLFWLGMYQFKSLNVRSFFASWMGFVLIYFLIFTWGIVQNNLTIFVDALPTFDTEWNLDFSIFNLREWVIAGYLMFLFILAGGKIFMSGISEKVRAITTLSYLYLFVIVVVCFFVLQTTTGYSWRLITYIPVSLLVAHYFTLSIRKWTASLFVFTFVVFIASLVDNYIPLATLFQQTIDFDGISNPIDNWFQNL
ncbi:MAG: hypothetical protein LBN93_03920 [Candidatus Symbiothrix sp.]|jgi:hypothetical protein|nr:hypothetical protein [Candidatus Symbiothrix sp.]